ncbi:MAG: endolytic transglycosylase MltG [Candidatus Acidiferrales bacterium]
MRRAFWVVVLLALLGAGAWFIVAWRLPYQGFASPGIYVDIPHGASRRTIARLLEENGIVRSRFAFEVLARLHPQRTLEAGEYYFDRPERQSDVFETIASGRVYKVQLVIPEGFDMFEIADLAAREGFLTREDFLAAARDPSPILDLAPGASSLEGFLAPATYEFPRHITGVEMVQTMVKRFRQEWTAVAEAEGGPPQDVAAVVTLASLVERETPQASERPLVAGVFTNRLQRGMPLECDPTVIYALEIAGRYTGSLDAADLRFASPYNTYENKGLPPGPIANPGEASLRAALDPPKTDYLYFVANTQGGHFFGKTLAEHDKNVERYRRLHEEQERKQSGDAPRGKPAAAGRPS